MIGLLVCDHAREELSHPDGSYPEMFRRLLPGMEFKEYYVCDGIFPASANECDGWIISGSRMSVYDDILWIRRLEEFTREIAASGKPCIGVCFGHQMIGRALGGEVRKAPTGWCAGIHPFEMHEKEPWMDPPQEKANLLMMCQDQVLSLPPGATIIASSALCPNAMIRIGKNMLGIQGHPEFSVSFERELIRINAPLMAAGQAEEELETLDRPVHNGLVGSWMMKFLTSAI
jgi:GMP synthase-like glutamine amidotransferase